MDRIVAEKALLEIRSIEDGVNGLTDLSFLLANPEEQKRFRSMFSPILVLTSELLRKIYAVYPDLETTKTSDDE